MSRKLLFIVNEAGYFASHRLSHARAAREAGWEVAIASAPSPAQQRLRDAGFAVHDLPLTRAGLRPDRELRAVAAAWRLIRRLRPDLVHCIALKAAVAGGLAARLARAPALVISIAGLGHVFTDPSATGRLLRLVFSGLIPLLVSRRSRVIVQNEDDLERLTSSATLRARALLIPGAGVDLETFSPRPEPDGPPCVLLASRMIWKKGVGEFVEAARRLRAEDPQLRFRLAGDSDPGNPAAIARAQLAAWHEEGAVEWLGQRDDMAALIAASHVFCLPSRYGEGVPKSLIEAAAAGRALVTTDMPGCRDIVRDGENGLLVPPGDVEALTEALGRLLADPALRRRLGARGREIACERFGLKDIVKATLAVYDELVLERRQDDRSSAEAAANAGSGGQMTRP